MKTSVLTASLLAALSAAPLAAAPKAPTKPSNVLFVMLDDVGVDQLHVFNPLAPVHAVTPVLDQIAAKGVRFTRFHTMPECSPSRTAFFTGRFPMRTGVTAALLPEDLPAAQISPYEVTTPQVLATAGYTSAMLGKWHLGGPENPQGDRMPTVLGWDYYSGNLSGGPPGFDVTVGGQYTKDTTTFSCGFPTGPGKGACWRQDVNGTASLDTNGGAGTTGPQCAALGGVPAVDADGAQILSCPGCTPPDFTKTNGYYSWERVTSDRKGSRRDLVRQYMTYAQTDQSVAWIKQQQARAGKPWMATVSYNSDHIPYQPAPDSIAPVGCVTSDLAQQRFLSDRMIEDVDREIGRLLIETGLAHAGPGGTVLYSPETTNTMVVIVGDNGSFLPSVKYPYNPLRSKGSVYETGILTPLLVAGPMVTSPGRAVEELTSCVDLFELFGEIAGVNVRKAVPSEHVLDSRGMLAYLKNPAQDGLRSHAFSQLGDGLKPPSLQIWPCVLTFSQNICTDILLTTEELCKAAGGESWGPEGGHTNPTVCPPDQVCPVVTYKTCCELKDAHEYDQLTVVPKRSWSIRNDAGYKLVQVEEPICDRQNPDDLYRLELYKLGPQLSAQNPLGIDNEDADLLCPGCAPLTAEAQTNYEELQVALQAQISSEVPCPGDGNLDKHVDGKDLAGVLTNMGRASVFDFNADGITDEKDLAIVQANLGTNCVGH
jgi:arylsulfatase A-like enzyme